jgi:parvulin-like peptidyl-prolyl isomerase
MNRKLLLLLLVAVSLSAAACGGGSPPAVKGDEVAVVGNNGITRAQFDNTLAQAKRSYAARKQKFPKPGTSAYTTLQAQILQFLIQRSEYDQKAKELGITISDADVTKRLEQVKKQYFGAAPPGAKPPTAAQIEQRYVAQRKAQGLTEADVRSGIRAQLVQEAIYNKVTKNVTVSNDEVKKYYDDHKQTYEQPATPESRDVRHILVKSHALALRIYRQLKAGTDFNKLALKYSIDPSKTNGGRLTICKQQQSAGCLKTVPPFEKVAFSLKTNQISPPVQTQYGWHVIQALSPVKPPQKAKPIPFDQVNAAIKQQLLQQKRQTAMTNWWNDTKKSFCSNKIAYRQGFAPPAQLDPCKQAAAKTGTG